MVYAVTLSGKLVAFNYNLHMITFDDLFMEEILQECIISHIFSTILYFSLNINTFIHTASYVPRGDIILVVHVVTLSVRLVALEFITECHLFV